MTNQPEHSTTVLRSSLRRAAFALALLCVLTMIATQRAKAQTYTVLHNFSGNQDGGYPYAGLTRDRAGNLYGTDFGVLHGNDGVVYRLVNVNKSGGPLFSVLYAFTGNSDGNSDGQRPQSRVIFGPDGALYGTTSSGGTSTPTCPYGCGTVFKLQPPPTFCPTVNCEWIETVLYRFQGGSDGEGPGFGDLAFDQAGNIYGTTEYGGTDGAGTVFQLHLSNGGWTESVLYTFTGGSDGGSPYSGVTIDQAGNLYGTTFYGGSHGFGVVYELSPVGSAWTETVLYTFQDTTNDGAYPAGGLISDPAGNFYGATANGGADNVGVAYELSPSNGGWVYQTLHSFTYTYQGGGPLDTLFRDTAGNLYGSATYNPYGFGGIFELANGNWTETGLANFGSCNSGCDPVGNVILDEQGNVYGTTLSGGSPGVGTVWEITP
jgi:uncharacterized repeat protein (TIGR03803 family)